MKARSLLGALMAAASGTRRFSVSRMFASEAFRPRHGTRNKEGLDAGYPGAKLVRKAQRKTLTFRHITRQS